MRAMSSLVVTPGMRAVSVAAWWRRSCRCRAPGAPVVRTAACQCFESVARRNGVPLGEVNTGSVGRGPVKEAR